MTTTPLPPFPRPYVYDPGRFGVAYSQTQMVDFATQARADLEAENQRLREALRIAHDHIDMNALRVSHCKDAATITATLESKP